MRWQFSIMNLVLLTLIANFATAWLCGQVVIVRLARRVETARRELDQYKLVADYYSDRANRFERELAIADYTANYRSWMRTVETNPKLGTIYETYDRLAADEPRFIANEVTMPYYLFILENGQFVFRRQYPTPAEEADARAGNMTIIWLERDPGRCELLRDPPEGAVLDHKGWERIPEE